VLHTLFCCDMLQYKKYMPIFGVSNASDDQGKQCFTYHGTFWLGRQWILKFNTEPNHLCQFASISHWASKLLGSIWPRPTKEQNSVKVKLILITANIVQPSKSIFAYVKYFTLIGPSSPDSIPSIYMRAYWSITNRVV
jgi:hypothetical protein